MPLSVEVHLTAELLTTLRIFAGHVIDVTGRAGLYFLLAGFHILNATAATAPAKRSEDEEEEKKYASD